MRGSGIALNNHKIDHKKEEEEQEEDRPTLRLQKKFVAALAPAWRKRIYELKDLKVFSLRDFSSDFSNYVTGNLWWSLPTKNQNIWYDMMSSWSILIIEIRCHRWLHLSVWKMKLFISKICLLIMRGHVYCFETGNCGYQFPDFLLTPWLEIMMDQPGRQIWKHRHR